MSVLKSVAAVGAVAALIAAAPGAKSHIVAQKARNFEVNALTIRKGETVVFKNVDDVTHNVFSLSPGIKFDIKTQKPGEETPITFANPGSGEVRCAIHPNMKLQLTVTD